MADDRSPPEGPASAWPVDSPPPGDDASPREVAAWARDVMGWVPLPMPSDYDVIAHASSIARRAVVDWVLDRGEEPDDETHQHIWDEARERAEAGRKGPIGYYVSGDGQEYESASDVTDALLDLWFVPPEHATGPRRHADERGVCILPGRSTKSLPVCLVDVDPDDGGDLQGEWGWQLPGPKATTPGGGLHTLVLSTGREFSSRQALAPGVDVIASGRTAIPIPSGRATPGRRWVRWEAPVIAPEQLRRRVGPRKVLPALPRDPSAGREPGDDADHGTGRVADILAAPTDNGSRNRSAECIVGILARPRACPPDFVREVLALLAEEDACRDRPSGDLAERAAEMASALTLGPRDATLAADVLALWIRLRDEARAPWSESKARAVARSVWRTCDRREEGQAGALDPSYLPPPRLPPAVLGAPPWRPTLHATAQSSSVAGAPGGTLDGKIAPEEATRSSTAGVLAPPETPAPEGPAWRGRLDPRTFCVPFAAFHDDAATDRLLLRTPISAADVMPLNDFLRGTPQDGPGYGWGPHLSKALGGLSPGDFRVVGAAGAKAGKTWFLSFLANGLALAAACRIMGAGGKFRDAPLVLPVWVTEMPKRYELPTRLVSQFLGVDMAAFTWGTEAAEAPGIQYLARKLGPSWTPEQVVSHARALEVAHRDPERSPLAFARHHVLKVIDMSRLPSAAGRGPGAVDHQSGGALVDHVADCVDHYRREMAERAGVAESAVVPLVIIDPGQRFAGHGRDAKAQLDALFFATVRVLCGEVEACVLGTSDTTKAAAKEITADIFLGRPGAALAADIFAGSQAIMHTADAIAVCAEVPPPGQLVTTQHVRLLQNRTGAPAEAYPFTWEMHLGRFRACPPEPLRQEVPAGDDGRGRPQGGRPSAPHPLAGRPMPRPREFTGDRDD